MNKAANNSYKKLNTISNTNTNTKNIKYEYDYFKIFLAILCIVLFALLIYYIVKKKPIKVKTIPTQIKPQTQNIDNKNSLNENTNIKPNEQKNNSMYVIEDEYMTTTLLKNLTNYEDSFYYDNCNVNK